jgi:hypothetical protein
LNVKAVNQLFELSLCVVCALAPSSLLTLNTVQAAPSENESARADDRESIHGKVSAKSDTSLTVDGKVIMTTAVTAVMKDGKPLTIGDITVGDKVKVSASKGTDGSLQAVSVEVMTKESAIVLSP